MILRHNVEIIVMIFEDSKDLFKYFPNKCGEKLNIGDLIIENDGSDFNGLKTKLKVIKVIFNKILSITAE